ncbi:MAG: hypothetical protein P3B98_03895 [Gemmatimonadota bacterium]|nr:hypothetical protein [Gemmatimonadota bacterium]
MPPLLLIALLLVAAWLVARLPGRVPWAEPLDRVLAGWPLPATAFVAAVAVTAYVWGSLDPVAVYHDEAAYLLQAELFARFRWSLPSPAVARAFEQAAVLVTPVLAPKMGPGHALALVPGVWLGLPALMPLLLTGAAAALVVLVARRIAGAPVALLTLVLWLTAPGNLVWRPTYFSETSSSVAWLGAWWCLLEWRATRRGGWLLGVAALTGWGAVTRPLTFLAFAVPLGVIVVHDIVRGKQWRQLAAALTLGTACLMIVPFQAWRVTGHPLRSPLSVYTQQYLPSDVIGFGLRVASPQRTLPADIARVYQDFDALHASHTLASLPATFGERAAAIFNMQFGGWRAVLAPALLVGVLTGGATLAFGLSTALLVVLTYLAYAHLPQWTVYYLELLPVLSFACARGLGRSLSWLAQRLRGATLPRGAEAVAAVLVLLLTLQPSAREVVAYRRRIEHLTEYQRQFFAAFQAIPERRALVFVRYGKGHKPHYSLVRNVADRQNAHVVTAYDLGAAANDSVRREFPDRTVYWIDTAQRQLQKIVFAP